MVAAISVRHDVGLLLSIHDSYFWGEIKDVPLIEQDNAGSLARGK